MEEETLAGLRLAAAGAHQALPEMRRVHANVGGAGSQPCEESQVAARER